MPISDTAALIRAATDGLKEIYQSGYRYKRVGVMLAEIVPDHLVQTDLFAEENPKSKRLMQVVDRINGEWGRNTMVFAAAGVERPWKMQQHSLSRRFTTRWNELPIARV